MLEVGNFEQETEEGDEQVLYWDRIFIFYLEGLHVILQLSFYFE